MRNIKAARAELQELCLPSAIGEAVMAAKKPGRTNEAHRGPYALGPGVPSIDAHACAIKSVMSLAMQIVQMAEAPGGGSSEAQSCWQPPTASIMSINTSLFCNLTL